LEISLRRKLDLSRAHLDAVDWGLAGELPKANCHSGLRPQIARPPIKDGLLMKKIGVVADQLTTDRRIAMIPQIAGKLTGLGAAVTIESGLGRALGWDDSAYIDVGCTVSTSRQEILEQAEIVLRLNPPPMDEIEWLTEGTVHVSYLDVFGDYDRLRALAARKVAAVGMDIMPRSTRAQKMDAISSQASLAGYEAVIEAAHHSNLVLPMMMTPAGTITPSRVFVIGAGVAGLQAIATARRLGAQVEAFDTRPDAQEQIASLGAKAVRFDLGETGQTKDGYAKQLTPEQLEIQRQEMAKVCTRSDIVITTAQLFGRPAPTIVTAEMVADMKPGSILVDLAVSTGGNVEGSKVGEIVNAGGVTIIGNSNLASTVPSHASQMYASNLFHFIDEFWNKEETAFHLDREDELIQGCLVLADGEVVHPMIKERMEAE
jgi:NAD(P) transhydrogenase subunit alpha